MRISDWSSDVCSSDLHVSNAVNPTRPKRGGCRRRESTAGDLDDDRHYINRPPSGAPGWWADEACGERKSGVWGKSVSVRVDLGGRRTHKKKRRTNIQA